MLDPAAPGLPDVAWLARLANEMFRSLPDGLPTSVPMPVGGVGVAPPSMPLPDVTAPGTSVPGEGELRPLLGGALAAPVPGVPGQASLAGATTPGAVGGVGLPPPSTPLPEVPALGTSVPGEAELRALLSGAFVAPVPPAPGQASPSTLLPEVPALTATVPGEAELRALLGPALALPVPGAQPPLAAPTSSAAPPPSFYFLEEAGHGVPAVAARPDVAPGTNFDANARRSDFPILAERVNGRPLIWLDNGATTQKPRAVIDRLVHYYEHENSNIHRAAHELAARATDAYEGAREIVRRFLHAGSVDEIVFVRGTTEGINLVAQSWGRRYIGAGDEIVITWLEHHANIVPWQMLCEQTGAKLRVVPVDDNGQVLIDEYGKLLGSRTKLVAFTQVSNALGTITPSHLMTRMAHAVGARVLLDGAQSVSHLRTDVQSIGCDWFVFSGHKIYGPTGIGAVYGRADVLEETPPWQGGGNMIRDVTFEHTEYHRPPARFEAGTGNIGDAVGLGAALQYVEQVGLEAIAAHEHDLLVHATSLLGQIPGLRLLGTAPEKAGVISFVINGLSSEEIGRALNQEGIAVRAGHHCAQPILRRFGVESTVRASLGLYNTHADIDALVSAVRRIGSGKPGMI